ncbi:dr1-associated corepressor homolog [Microplitis demolitor]|uniref:dr1-associated corepressor homolog n=1 Tax=Microplitis demolitor TaxID=69319 RepID=UPI0004CDC434|nr:dr1-associated corepressor homolog [Microplitis demolitor]
MDAVDTAAEHSDSTSGSQSGQGTKKKRRSRRSLQQRAAERNLAPVTPGGTNQSTKQATKATVKATEQRGNSQNPPVNQQQNLNAQNRGAIPRNPPVQQQQPPRVSNPPINNLPSGQVNPSGGNRSPPGFNNNNNQPFVRNSSQMGQNRVVRPRFCYNCGSLEHLGYFCHEPRRDVCMRCGKVGKTAVTCVCNVDSRPNAFQLPKNDNAARQ